MTAIPSPANTNASYNVTGTTCFKTETDSPWCGVALLVVSVAIFCHCAIRYRGLGAMYVAGPGLGGLVCITHLVLMAKERAVSHRTDLRPAAKDLHRAAREGDVGTINALSENEEYLVNVVDTEGRTPLHVAVLEGKIEVIKALFKKGATFTPDHEGMTPLHIASNKNAGLVYALLTDAKEALILTPTYINAVDNKGMTALHRAAQHGDKVICQILVEKGSSLKAKDNSGNTPLHLAVSSNCKSVVQYLLEQGVDIHARNNDQDTPLHRCTTESHRAIYDLLLLKGADPNAQGGGSKTPFLSCFKPPDYCVVWA
jgi:ankyrin repeat protein